MAGQTYTIKCAKCDVPLDSSNPEPEPEDMVCCPNCGEEDTLKNAMDEVRQYVMEVAGNGVGNMIENKTKHLKHMKVKRSRRSPGVFRFKADFTFPE